jgi:decaprenylphospho-beta-D-ribofuranose 2-oxidase
MKKRATISTPILSFGRCKKGMGVIVEPDDVDGVKKVFADAATSGSRVTIHGGGHSFDGQAVPDSSGEQIVLSPSRFTNVCFAPGGDATLVTLGAGVPWVEFLRLAISEAGATGPIRIPGSMQTGRHATVGGTLAGDCLSRFSGTMGKESAWIESFHIVLPNGKDLDVTKTDPLFNAVVGGHGYIGFVTEATYRLVPVENGSCAHTTITTHTSLPDLFQKQLDILASAPAGSMRAVSSAAFTDLLPHKPTFVKGGVFNSFYARPSGKPAEEWPLYSDTENDFRTIAEIMARDPLANWAIHEYLFLKASMSPQKEYENDLENFIFFMDGNTTAKRRFEEQHPGKLFPIVQQTYVIPLDKGAKTAAAFAQNCIDKMSRDLIRPTEFDALFVRADECLMSANYHMDGFAVSIAFEPGNLPTEDWDKGCAPDPKIGPGIPKLLRELSVDCQKAGGRIHLVKNVHADPEVFRSMFPRIEDFEDIKRDGDPGLILGNPFSDLFFNFKKKKGRAGR